jgi:hypothetical protein
MQNKLVHSLEDHYIPVFENSLLRVFKGGDGFGLILFYWALMISLVGSLSLIVIGFVQSSLLALVAGFLALGCYIYLGRIGNDIFGK